MRNLEVHMTRARAWLGSACPTVAVLLGSCLLMACPGSGRKDGEAHSDFHLPVLAGSCCPLPVAPDVLLLAVDQRGSILRGGRPLTPREMGEYIQGSGGANRAVAREQSILLIEADARAPWVHVQTILEVCANATIGLHQVGLVCRGANAERGVFPWEVARVEGFSPVTTMGEILVLVIDEADTWSLDVPTIDSPDCTAVVGFELGATVGKVLRVAELSKAAGARYVRSMIAQEVPRDAVQGPADSNSPAGTSSGEGRAGNPWGQCDVGYGEPWTPPLVFRTECVRRLRLAIAGLKG